MCKPLVGGGHPVGVVEDPVAADAVGRLEDVERDAALVQRLGRGDAGRSGADHGGPGELVHRRPSAGGGTRRRVRVAKVTHASSSHPKGSRDCQPVVDTSTFASCAAWSPSPSSSRSPRLPPRRTTPAPRLNIIPSGQYGGVPINPNADVQAKMYDGLTPLFDHVTPTDLTTYFKSEKFGAGDSCPCTTEPTPRSGLTLVRDKFNVPHLTGKTRDDVTWGAGWVLAEDRALLLAQGRYPARFAALDVPGIDAFWLVTGLKSVTVDPAGRRAHRPPADRRPAVLGARRAAGSCTTSTSTSRASTPSCRPWTSRARRSRACDIYSVNALAGQIFGQGGGDEARRSELLVGAHAATRPGQGPPGLRRPLRAPRRRHADDDRQVLPLRADPERRGQGQRDPRRRVARRRRRRAASTRVGRARTSATRRTS